MVGFQTEDGHHLIAEDLRDHFRDSLREFRDATQPGDGGGDFGPQAFVTQTVLFAPMPVRQLERRRQERCEQCERLEVCRVRALRDVFRRDDPGNPPCTHDRNGQWHGERPTGSGWGRTCLMHLTAAHHGLGEALIRCGKTVLRLTDAGQQFHFVFVTAQEHANLIGVHRARAALQKNLRNLQGVPMAEEFTGDFSKNFQERQSPFGGHQTL